MMTFRTKPQSGGSRSGGLCFLRRRMGSVVRGVDVVALLVFAMLSGSGGTRDRGLGLGGSAMAE